MTKSLEEFLGQALKDAKVEHSVAKLNGKATDEDWPGWYAHYLVSRLTPILTTLSAPMPVGRPAVWNGGPSWITANCHDTGDC